MNYFKNITLAAGALALLFAAERSAAAQDEVPTHLTLDQTVRFVGKGEFFGSKDFRRAAGDWKLLAGEDLGFYAQGQHVLQDQEFGDGDLEGKINRIGGGAYKYFPFSIDSPKDSAIYTDVFAIYGERDFDFTRDSDGNTFPFGNTEMNLGGKVGFVKRGDNTSFDDDKVRFDTSAIKVLATFAYGTGDMTGDLEGDYERKLATVYAQARLNQDWFVRGGVFRKEEDLMDGEWENNENAYELGVGTDAYLFLGQTPFEVYLKGTRRELETTRNGVTSSSAHNGAALSLTFKPYENVEVGGFIGHEAGDGDRDGLENYGGIGIKINLGPSGRK